MSLRLFRIHWEINGDPRDLRSGARSTYVVEIVTRQETSCFDHDLASVGGCSGISDLSVLIYGGKRNLGNVFGKLLGPKTMMDDTIFVVV